MSFRVYSSFWGKGRSNMLPHAPWTAEMESLLQLCIPSQYLRTGQPNAWVDSWLQSGCPKELWVGGASEMCVNNLHVLGRGWELGLYFALLASLVWLEERIWGRMCYGLSWVPPKFMCCLLIPTTSECHCTWRQGLLGSS